MVVVAVDLRLERVCMVSPRERERESMCVSQREEYVKRGLREEKNWVKMAKFHHFQKFVAIKHYFGTKWECTTFYVLELTKLEF